MRKFVFISVLFYFHYITVYSVINEDNLNKNIKLSSKELTIENIIKTISDATGIMFSYEETEIPLQQIITFPSLEGTVKDILDQLEKKAGISYTFRSNVIILKKSAKNKSLERNHFTISGILKDSTTSETLPYATVGVYGQNAGTLTNAYGFYSLTLPVGSYKLIFRFLGYEEIQRDVNLYSDFQINLFLKTQTNEIGEVTVTKRNDDLRNVERRLTPIDVKTIQSIPSLFGEADLLRNVLLLPGINTLAEVGGGMIVRGGSSDQNLLLLDEATVYNPTHLLGTYSVFNPAIVKDVKFFKSGIPLSYGGRVSSVMDVTQKDGNMRSFHGSAGIGLLSSNAEIEGPIIKDRASYVIAARRSYLDIFFKYIPNENLEGYRTYFYDVNAKINVILNPRNRLFLSCYLGSDLADSKWQDQEYGNITTTLRYNHIFSNKLFSNTSLIYSRYNMGVVDSSNNDMKINMGLSHYEFKNAFTFYTTKHNIEFGLRAIYYTFNPGEYESVVDFSLKKNIKLQQERAIESAFYLSDNFKINSQLELQYGMRSSLFHFIGPYDMFVYEDNQPRSSFSISDTMFYSRNKVVQSYSSIEPRIALKFDLNNNHSFKLSYNKGVQYIQQVSQTTFSMPYDMWKSANKYIYPLVSHQYALGYFTSLFTSSVDLSCELYYKDLFNVLEVKQGGDIWLNKTLDADLVQGIGKTYGLEILANKSTGRLTGIVSYCWSRSKWKVNSKFPEMRINGGHFYPSDNDIPHKFTISGEYRVSSRFSWTFGFMYATGRPVSYPDGQYYYMGTYLPYYSGKNLDRMKDFHRLDIGAIVKGKSRPEQRFHGSWVFSVYNLYARKNPYSVYIQRIPGSKNTEAIKMWAMGIVPSVTYNLKF